MIQFLQSGFAGTLHPSFALVPIVEDSMAQADPIWLSQMSPMWLADGKVSSINLKEMFYLIVFL